MKHKKTIMQVEKDLFNTIFSRNRPALIELLSKLDDKFAELMILYDAYSNPAMTREPISVSMNTESIFRASVIFFHDDYKAPLLDDNILRPSIEAIESLTYPDICSFFLYSYLIICAEFEAAKKILEILRIRSTPNDLLRDIFVELGYVNILNYSNDVDNIKALELCDQIEERYDLDKLFYLQLDLNRMKSKSLQKLGRLSEAISYLEKNYQLIEHSELDLIIYQIYCFFDLAKLYQMQNNLEKAEIFYMKVIDLGSIHRMIESKVVASRHHLGNIKISQGKYDQAKKIHLMNLSANTNNPSHLSRSYNSLGVIEFYTGNLREAEEYYNKCLNDAIVRCDDWFKSISYENLGEVAMSLGYYDQGLIKFNESLKLKKENGDQYQISQTYHYIGICQYHLSYLTQAINSLEASIKIKEQLGNNLEISKSLFYLFLVRLRLHEVQSMENIINQLELLEKDQENKHIALRRRLAKVIYLKTKQRNKFQAEAQDLLYSIIDEPLLDHQLTILAYIHLVEILLKEYQTFQQREIIEEIDTHFANLNFISNQQHNIALRINILTLQAEYTAIAGDPVKAIKILDEAYRIIEDNQLDRLAMTISEVKEGIVSRVADMKMQLELAQPLLKEIERDSIHNYIRNVRSFIDMENTETNY